MAFSTLSNLPTEICDECKSPFFTGVPPMTNLCPNCSNLIYAYQNCEHQFDNDNCLKCGWNGKIST